MSDVLDPLHLPLWGSRLVEASAGTGKTWTIAALYLRLVLGHGEPGEAFERALAPSEILVMTFTRAATRELSDRIRSRLLEAAQCFRGEQSPDESDAFLRELMDAYAADDARSHAAWRLSAAAEAMDDAAVHTIDAWCQRMLREHAFDSGNLFDEELMADELNMTEEAARDYWRQQLYPLSGGALDAALDVWPSVDTLIADVRSLIEHSEPGHGVPAELGALVTQVMDTQRQALKRMKGGWAQRAQEMRGWLDSQFNSKSCPFSKNKIHPRYYGPWLDALGAWAGQPELHLPSLGKGRERFTPGGMSEALNGKGGVELHPHFEAFEALMTELEALPSQRVAIRRHAAACVKNRLDMLKEQAGAFGFADMLDRLDAALAGPNAQRLRERIVTQYPVALIDEFQDTSAVQFRIFDRLYRAELNDASTTLLLIGDPKQSIYGFRGADLDSYLRARSATTGRHYVLGTNHRSTAALVAAVNRLFDQAEARPGQGAFLFRRPGGNNPLPFVAVQARGRAERLINAQGPVPALTVCHDAELRAGGDSQRRFAARCAEHIVTLLDDPQARYVSPDGSEKRLRHADIAVLVRSRVEAAAVRRELRRRGVASVYLSENDSVFDSGEARDLLHWLKAVASPLDMRLARAAMATATVGLSMPELARLASDEDAYEQRSEQLRELHTVWLRQGVLAMLRQSLHRLALPSRWLHETDGERRLTNVLHLAELLQTASTQLDGEQALIRWLGDQIEGAVAAGDERIVRLESDADLVKVVTVYKSKGLEYPVVYLPFATSFRAVDRKHGFVRVPDENGERQLDFVMSEAALALADEERLREDLRLLYVALTRARHALWVGVAALKDRGSACVLHRSALGSLLTGGQVVAGDQLPAVLEQAFGQARADLVDEGGDAAALDVVLLAAPPETPVTRLRRRESEGALYDAPAYDGRFERHWAIGSFSALVRDIAAPSIQHVMGEAVREEELLGALQEAPVPASADAPWHRFPRGALPGNFLHDQLEWLSGEDFALADSPALQEQLRRRCEREGWGHRADDVVAWLRAVVGTELPPVGVSLDSVTHRLAEMEFWFPSDGLASAEVDALCRQHLLGERPRPALPARQLRGMLMGFADLVFEHEGRYWVLDYKSNALGSRDADYHRGALESAMAEHRYDVQAAVYLLALHRLLRARLGEAYRPQQHLGGAVFLFLRGIEGPERGCYVVPPVAALLDGLDEALGLREEAL